MSNVWAIVCYRVNYWTWWFVYTVPFCLTMFYQLNTLV